MKGGLGEGEMCVGCVCVYEEEDRRGGQKKRRSPLPWRALGAPGLRAQLVCKVLKASR